MVLYWSVTGRKGCPRPLNVWRQKFPDPVGTNRRGIFYYFFSFSCTSIRACWLVMRVPSWGRSRSLIRNRTDEEGKCIQRLNGLQRHCYSFFPNMSHCPGGSLYPFRLTTIRPLRAASDSAR